MIGVQRVEHCNAIIAKQPSGYWEVRYVSNSGLLWAHSSHETFRAAVAEARASAVMNIFARVYWTKRTASFGASWHRIGVAS